MKREGRQHGMVRTYRILPSSVNPRPDSRFVKKFDLPPTIGLFTKVPSKPTNHSKFTGKCGTPRCTGCHMHPTGKSKPKIKGTQKLKSCGVIMNSLLVSWRVVDGQPGLSFSGFSAIDLMDHLSGGYINDNEVYDPDCEYDWSADLGSTNRWDNDIEVGITDDNDEKHNNDDNASFCEVGSVLDEVEGDEDEGWCLVGET